MDSQLVQDRRFHKKEQEVTDKQVLVKEDSPKVVNNVNPQQLYKINNKNPFDQKVSQQKTDQSQKQQQIIENNQEVLIKQKQQNQIIKQISFYNHQLYKLQQKIKSPSLSDQQRITILSYKVKILQKVALEITKTHLLSSFQYWKKLLIQCKRIKAINKKLKKIDVDNILMQINCLLNLHNFKQASTLLKQNKQLLKNVPEFWIIYSKYYKKTNRIIPAKIKLQKAVVLNMKNKQTQNLQLIKKEEKLIQNVINNHHKQKIKESITLRDVILEGRQKKINEKYKILTIDGGGWRGILTAFWLSEIQKRLKKPSSQLFNMGAGTSVGSMVVSSIALPSLGKQPKIPRFTACDVIVNLQADAHKFFSSNGIRSIFASKYKDKGRSYVFNKYCGQTKLSQSLMDIVIPAVNNHNMGFTHLFTSREAKINPLADVTFYDAVKASTSAPTFFPVHQIQGLGNFIDGGLQANNPARLALNQALKYGYKSEDIYMLSFGTGVYDYVKSIESTQKDRNILYWASNITNFTLASQQANTDLDMYLHLKDRYFRWQLWYHKPIPLDDWSQKSTNYLLDLANQHLEELYISDDNRFNKLLQILDQ